MEVFGTGAVTVGMGSGIFSSRRFAFDLLEAGTDEPQHGVQHEEGEHAGEEQVHEEADVVERRVQLAIAGVGMGLVLDEACISSGVAAAAGGNEVRFVDRRVGIGGGQDFVRPVAIPAAGGFGVAAEQAELRVEGVAVGGEFIAMAGSADGRGLHAEVRGGGFDDAVGGVAVGADRRAGVAGGDGFTVHAFLILLIDADVATAAGSGNIGAVRRAMRVGVAEDFVRAVAAGAVGGDQKAFFAEGEAVNRVNVEVVDVGEVEFLRHGGVAVAAPAGFGDIQGVDGGIWIRFCDDFVGISVAAGAGMALPTCTAVGGGTGYRRSGFGVDAAGDTCTFIGVAGFALDRGGTIGVRIVVNIFVAVAAFEVAVDARVELIGVDADVLAVGVLHGGIAVAGKAVGIRVERTRGGGQQKG